LRKKIDYYVKKLFENIDGLCQLILLGHIECVSMTSISTRLSIFFKDFFNIIKGVIKVFFLGVLNLFYDNTTRKHEFTVVDHSRMRSTAWL